MLIKLISIPESKFVTSHGKPECIQTTIETFTLEAVYDSGDVLIAW